jgi:hypothetical protein
LRFKKLARIGSFQVPIAQKAVKKLSRTKSRHTDLSKLILGTSGQPQSFEIQGFKAGLFIDVSKVWPKIRPKKI